MSVAVDIAASGNQRVKREVVGTLNAHDRAGGDVLLRSGTVIDGFRIVRRTAPGSDTYVAEFDWGQVPLSCPLYAFLPRTRIVESGT